MNSFSANIVMAMTAPSPAPAQEGGGGGRKKNKSTPLPSETVEYLKSWIMSPEHIGHPYPTDEEKARIMAETGIDKKQLMNWFVNNRKRYWKPRADALLGRSTEPEDDDEGSGGCQNDKLIRYRYSDSAMDHLAVTAAARAPQPRASSAVRGEEILLAQPERTTLSLNSARAKQEKEEFLNSSRAFIASSSSSSSSQHFQFPLAKAEVNANEIRLPPFISSGIGSGREGGITDDGIQIMQPRILECRKSQNHHEIIKVVAREQEMSDSIHFRAMLGLHETGDDDNIHINTKQNQKSDHEGGTTAISPGESESNCSISMAISKAAVGRDVNAGEINTSKRKHNAISEGNAVAAQPNVHENSATQEDDSEKSPFLHKEVMLLSEKSQQLSASTVQEKEQNSKPNVRTTGSLIPSANTAMRSAIMLRRKQNINNGASSSIRKDKDKPHDCSSSHEEEKDLPWQKSAPPSRRCKTRGCKKWLKSKCDGFCLTCYRAYNLHFDEKKAITIIEQPQDDDKTAENCSKNNHDDAAAADDDDDAADSSSDAVVKSPLKEGASKSLSSTIPAWRFCKAKDCTKRRKVKGFCRSHAKSLLLPHPEGSGEDEIVVNANHGAKVTEGNIATTDHHYEHVQNEMEVCLYSESLSEKNTSCASLPQRFRNTNYHKRCKTDGCDKYSRSEGFCSKCYNDVYTTSNNIIEMPSQSKQEEAPNNFIAAYNAKRSKINDSVSHVPVKKSTPTSTTAKNPNENNAGPSPSNLCIAAGCEKWRRPKFNGFCKSHYELANNPPAETISTTKSQKSAPITAKAKDSTATKAAPKPWKFCIAAGCEKWRRPNCNGLCQTHYNLTNNPPAETTSTTKSQKLAPAVAKAKNSTAAKAAPNPSDLCKLEGCERYRRARCNGFCQSHAKHNLFANDIPTMESRKTAPTMAKIASSTVTKATPNPSDLCKLEGCERYRRAHCNGFCKSHAELANLSSANAISMTKSRNLSHIAATLTNSAATKAAPKPWKLCKLEGCEKWRRPKCSGFCQSHAGLENLLSAADDDTFSKIKSQKSSLKPRFALGSVVYALLQPTEASIRVWHPGVVSSYKISNAADDDERYGVVRHYCIQLDNGDLIDNLPDHLVCSAEDGLIHLRKDDCTSSVNNQSWMGVENVTDPTSHDGWAKYVGWYVAKFDSEKYIFSKLADALQAYDASVVRRKGMATDKSDLNLPESWELLFTNNENTLQRSTLHNQIAADDVAQRRQHILDSIAHRRELLTLVKESRIAAEKMATLSSNEDQFQLAATKNEVEVIQPALETAEEAQLWSETGAAQDSVQLFSFFHTEEIQSEEQEGGRPKRRLKAVARFDSQSYEAQVNCKAGHGFSCPRCSSVCSYDSKVCAVCFLECCYEAGVGVVVLKERNDIGVSSRKQYCPNTTSILS